MDTAELTLASGPPFKSRFLRAATWLLAGNFTAQVLRLGSNLILTRLLMPEAFGLMAAVNTLYMAILMFSDLGISQSIVRSRHGDEPRFLGTAWLAQILRGGLLAVFVLGLAFAVWFGAGEGWFAAGTVYADPRLPSMIAVFALVALIQGAESVRLASAQRHLHTRQMVRLELTTQLITILVTIGAAWLTRSPWALIFGALSGTALKTGLSHLVLPGERVRPCWDRSHALEIVGFGKWIFISSIIGFLAANGEKLILGGSLGLAMFGVFAIASNLMAAVIGIYGTLNDRVIFPGLSLVLRERDPAHMARIYTRMQQLADLFLGMVSGLLLFAGHWIVHLLYDARYAEAGWMLQCLGLGLLGMRHQVLEQLMFTLGHSAWVSAINATRAVSLLIFIPLGAALGGETGAIWGVAASQFASWPLSLRFKHQQGLLNLATEKWWLPALLAGMAIGFTADRALAAIVFVH